MIASFSLLALMDEIKESKICFSKFVSAFKCIYSNIKITKQIVSHPSSFIEIIPCNILLQKAKRDICLIF